MGYEDILSGQEPLPSAADPNQVVPRGWLDDITSAVTSVAAAALPAVGSYFQNQMTIKNQMGVQAARSGMPGNMQYPGLGYANQQLIPWGAQPQPALPANYMYMGPQGIQVGPGDFGMPGGAGNVMPGVVGGGSSSAPSLMPGGSSMFHMGGGRPIARATRLVWGQNPVTGEPHVWMHVGSLNKLVRLGLQACGVGRARHRRRRARARYCPR